MILGISSYTFGWSVGVPSSMPAKPMDENDLVDKTISWKLRCLQIGDNLPLHTLSKKKLTDLHDRVHREGIRLEIGARGLTEKRLDDYLELSKFFQSPLLRFVIDEDGYEPGIAQIVKIIGSRVKTMREIGVKLGIENHDRFAARELANLIDQISDDHVGVCLDCVNSLGAGEGIEHVSTVLAPYTINLHVKDYRIQRLSHKMGFIVEGCPAGTGMTNVPSLLELLSRHGRCESAVLEQWVVPEKSIEDTVSKEHAWAEQGIRYLKALKIK